MHLAPSFYCVVNLSCWLAMPNDHSTCPQLRLAHHHVSIHDTIDGVNIYNTCQSRRRSAGFVAYRLLATFGERNRWACVEHLPEASLLYISIYLVTHGSIFCVWACVFHYGAPLTTTLQSTDIANKYLARTFVGPAWAYSSSN